jgi:acetyl esterase
MPETGWSDETSPVHVSTVPVHEQHEAVRRRYAGIADDRAGNCCDMDTSDGVASSDAKPVGDVRELAIEGPDGDLTIRVYTPEGDGPHPALMFFHGGGWVIGSLDTHDDLCRALMSEAGCVVISVEYRLAPAHPFPAAVEDAYAATTWVAENPTAIAIDPDRLAVGGDSAGGNLSAAVTLMARDRDGPSLCHQSLLYPAVSSPVLGAFDSYEHTDESMEAVFKRYAQQPTDVRNEYAAPLLAHDLSVLPPATVVTAEFDPVRDESFAYVDRLCEAGVTVEHAHYEGMVHGFLSIADMDDRARDGINLVATELQKAFE